MDFQSWKTLNILNIIKIVSSISNILVEKCLGLKILYLRSLACVSSNIMLKKRGSTEKIVETFFVIQADKISGAKNISIFVSPVWTAE